MLSSGWQKPMWHRKLPNGKFVLCEIACKDVKLPIQVLTSVPTKRENKNLGNVNY